jgi:amino acid permease
MSALRFVNLASLGALVYVGIVLISELKSYFSEFSGKYERVAAFIDLNLFTGCSMTFFAYTCQIQLLPIYSEMVNPQFPRIAKVINRAISIDFLFYFIIAASGYFSQFDHTAKIVLERELLPGQDHDYFLLVGVVAVIVCVISAFPMNFNPFRQHFFDVVFGRDEFSNAENLVLTLVYVAISTLVSIVFPNISKVISILGGLIATTMAYLIPLIIQLRLSNKSFWHPSKSLITLFFGMLILGGYTSVVITVYEISTGREMMDRWLVWKL